MKEFVGKTHTMRILFLSTRFLLPMDTGGKIRTGKILEQLSKKHDITLISNVEYSKDAPYLDQINNFSSKFIAVPYIETKRYTLLFFIKLFIKSLSRYPVNVLNDTSYKLCKAIKKEYEAEHYDLAICDFIQSALNFNILLNIPTILFQHNVESMIARRHFEYSKNLFIRLFWWLQWKKMYYFEKKISKSFHKVIAVSKEDKGLFKKLYNLDNVETIPTGVDIDYFIPKIKNNYTNKVVFCGSMDWLPNEDAILYFIKEILPVIKQRKSDFQLIVVGRNPSPTLKNFTKQYPEIILTGWVDDIRPYIVDSMLVIVPIRIGGGTRMKIYEAMAMGKTVISTPVGAEGLPVTNGENIIIEDEPIRFANRIIELIENNDERERIALNALAFVRRHFAWQHVAEIFIQICEKVVYGT